MFYYYFLIIVLYKLLFIRCDWIQIPQINQNAKIVNNKKSTIMHNSDFMHTVLRNNINFNGRFHNPQMMTNPLESLKIIQSESIGSKKKTKSQNIQNSLNIKYKENLEEFNNDDEIKPFSTMDAMLANDNTGEKELREVQMRIDSDNNFLKLLGEFKDTAVYKQLCELKTKLSFLVDLRDEILDTIKTNFDKLWPPKRRKRDFMQGESHMDFPSAEGALMTISFLTFAVFLIKLVLQVINTIKSKHYSYNGFDTMPMGTVNVVKKNRFSREVVTTGDNLNQMTNILNAIEKLKN